MLRTFKVTFTDEIGLNEKLYETDNLRQLLEYIAKQDYAERILRIEEAPIHDC